MPKKMLIDATHPEETRVVVVDGNKVEEFDFETLNKRQLAGNIYLAKVTRVEPSLQAAFVDYGGNRHGFLAFAEIHPDYYQIPIADRKALLEEERALARAEDDEDDARSRRADRRAEGGGGRGRRDDRRGPARAEAAAEADAVRTGAIDGMDLVDLGEEVGADALFAADAPVGSPADGPADRPAEGDPAADPVEPFRAMDTASETDDEIESIAEEDVAEEIKAPRPRARRYKIQEVVKVRQIMLVQVVKEERGNKGAALTTYLSLAGRYCVLMPNTARGGGISRKITQAADRKKLKEIAAELEVPEGAGLIIRTAGAKRTKAEIHRDYEYLMRLWEQVRELTLRSIAPAAIYEEGNLIKRSIRDLYSREIDEVLVEGEAGYRTAKDFMRMIMPTHARAVQQYTDPIPLFARHGVESYLSGMFNPTVQLKSGGYIVIGITEALVAIDVNSGRSTREGSIEETALKTNLEAADEVARQLRLRDLAGLIVIDFIDMEERRNNAAVEKRLKDKLKTDRARIQVGRISGFGLLEMSRQRLRPGMLESTTQPCAHCHGTGLIRSDDSLALTIIRALEEEGTRKRSKEVLLKAPVAIVNYLMNAKREHIALIEARYAMSVRIEADPAMVSPDFAIEKFKTALRAVPEPSAAISGNAALMGAAVDDGEDPPLEDVEGDEADAAEADAAAEGPGEGPGDGGGKKKRKRRRRRRGGGNGAAGQSAADGTGEADGEDEEEDEVAEAAPAGEAPALAPGEAPALAPDEAPALAPDEAPARKLSRTRKPRTRSQDPAEAAAPDPAADRPAEEAVPAKKSASRSRPAKSGGEDASPGGKRPPSSRSRAPKAAAGAADAAAPEAAPEPAAAPEPEAAPEPAAAVAAPADPAPGAEPPADPKPKRKGWWSLGR